MSPSPGLRSCGSAIDRDEFDAQASRMLLDLAAATGSPPDDLRRSAAESLVTLRIAGELVLPALRSDTASGDEGRVRNLIEGPLSELVAVASQGCLATGTLWGNIASVVESSARIIAAEQPQLAARAIEIATRTLAQEPLLGCWSGEIGVTFRRTTCCLVVGPDPDELRCGDCVRRGSPA